MDRIDRRERLLLIERGRTVPSTVDMPSVYHNADRAGDDRRDCRGVSAGHAEARRSRTTGRASKHQATVKKPSVGRNEQVRGAASGAWVVSEPPTTATIRPRPVFTMADRVAGPSGLIFASSVSACTPD